MDIFNASAPYKERFRKSANQLLNHGFLLKRKATTQHEYLFVLQNKNAFMDYFDLLGYEVKINETQGVIGLENVFNTGRIRLKKKESLLLLILRLLYIEKRKEVSLHQEVIVLVDEVHAKYGMLKIENKTYIDKKTLVGALRLFRKYHLLMPLDTDISKGDSRLTLYPSILLAVSNENIETLYQSTLTKLATYEKGGDANADEAAYENPAD